MLRPEERNWLTGVQSDMMTAAGKAEIYSGAIRAYLEDPVPWWHVIHRYRRWRGLRHVVRLYTIYDEEVRRCADLILGWTSAYEITAGENRGPIFPANL